jgi:hypothetical protein
MAIVIGDEWKQMVDAGWSIDVGSRAVERGWIDAATFPEEHVTTPAVAPGAPAIPRSLERSFEYRSRQYRTDVLEARGGKRRRRVVTIFRGRVVPR